MKVPKILLLIFILTLFIRLFKLDTFPLGFHIDEAKVAWEALSILKTGKDDHGNFLALHYNSFGDYRPTGIFYTTIPSLLIFGNTEFAVRFSSAFFGALTVFPIYFLTLTITNGNKKGDRTNEQLALIASLILAIIPWHIVTSRATSEVIISCFLILSSLALLPKKTIFSFVLLTLSFFFYHSARVMGPLLMFIWIIYLLSQHKALSLKKVTLGLIITTIFSLILLLSPVGQARYNQVKPPAFSIRNTIIQYSSYFDPTFLIGDIAKPFRYKTDNVGLVSIPLITLFLLGTYLIIKTNDNKILLLFFALAPLPAALTLEDSPNLHRSFLMLPFLVIIAAIGMDYLLKYHKKIFYIFSFLIAVTFLTFTLNYLNISNNFSFDYRSPNAKELSLYIDQEKTNFDKIYVTNDPDSPYSWYAFFNNIDPSKINPEFQKETDGKWQFENIIWDHTRCPAAEAFEDTQNNKSFQKIMVVDNGTCYIDFKRTHPKAKMVKEFTSNKKVNYRVWEYEPNKN